MHGSQPVAPAAPWCVRSRIACMTTPPPCSHTTPHRIWPHTLADGDHRSRLHYVTDKHGRARSPKCMPYLYEGLSLVSAPLLPVEAYKLGPVDLEKSCFVACLASSLQAKPAHQPRILSARWFQPALRGPHHCVQPCAGISHHEPFFGGPCRRNTCCRPSARDTRMDDAQDGYESTRTMHVAGVALRPAVSRPPTAPRPCPFFFLRSSFLAPPLDVHAFHDI